MRFLFVTLGLPGVRKSTTPDTWYLYPDNWDDGFRFETTFFLSYTDATGESHDIGTVKIAQFGMGEGSGASSDPSPGTQGLRRPQLPSQFKSLSKYFFSLGQDADYYKNLQKLGQSTREEVLRRLGDIAFDDAQYRRALAEEVTSDSLMRFVNRKTAEGQFRRIARGGVSLSRFEFTYSSSAETSARGHSLLFKVDPYVKPPTNIHVLIGRNGVGKTRLLNRMCQTLVGAESPKDQAVVTFRKRSDDDPSSFTKVISVSFSAFDSIDQPIPRSNSEYFHVGLRRPSGKPSPKSPSMLAEDFAESLEFCVRGEEALERWRRAMAHLESDPVFKDAGVADLIGAPVEFLESSIDRNSIVTRASTLFHKLSSGHKVVLLTMTRLVEHVEEASLILIDEPESHLHPPLLSAFVRALSDLLGDRNGVAIVATHSPVVLQEVPKECAWILSGRTADGTAYARRPERETFAENVSVLTDSVFELEVTESGFHRLLKDAVTRGHTYERIVKDFRGMIGGEGKIMLRSLIATRDSEGIS